VKTLTNTQWTIAFLAVWFVVFLILWFIWEMSDREFRWWTTALYIGVIAVASFLALKMSPSTQSRGRTPNWMSVIAVIAIIAAIAAVIFSA
jgi:hypothetical protein